MSLCLRVAARSVCDCKRRTLQPLCRTQSLGTSACSLKPVSVFNKNLEEMSRGIVAGLKTEEHPVVHKTFGETVAACENVQEHLRGFCNTVQLGFCNTVQLRSALGPNIHTATPPALPFPKLSSFGLLRVVSAMLSREREWLARDCPPTLHSHSDHGIVDPIEQMPTREPAS